MLIDTSILVAILLQELGYEHYEQSIAYAPDAAISSVALVEACFVTKDPRAVFAYLQSADIRILDFSLQDAQEAITAFQQFGKGHHPAKLNILDCMMYGAAKTRSWPLLFKGDDFNKTDIISASNS